jgi:hypothetical protein
MVKPPKERGTIVMARSKKEIILTKKNRSVENASYHNLYRQISLGKVVVKHILDRENNNVNQADYHKHKLNLKHYTTEKL